MRTTGALSRIRLCRTGRDGGDADRPRRTLVAVKVMRQGYSRFLMFRFEVHPNADVS